MSVTSTTWQISESPYYICWKMYLGQIPCGRPRPSKRQMIKLKYGVFIRFICASAQDLCVHKREARRQTLFYQLLFVSHVLGWTFFLHSPGPLPHQFLFLFGPVWKWFATCFLAISVPIGFYWSGATPQVIPKYILHFLVDTITLIILNTVNVATHSFRLSRESPC